MTTPRKIILRHKHAPGDTVVLTALVRDIALARPGEFLIDVDTSAPDFWRHNPYLTPLRSNSKRQRDIESINIGYGRGIRDQNYETVHFVSYFHRDFERQCRVKIPLLEPKPDLHLSAEERDQPLVSGRYWVIISGGKSDFTAKVWETAKFQEVVTRLRAYGLRFVQIGSRDRGHWHPPLAGALDMVGQTNLRDMMRLIQHSDGVICGITAAMHVAAALERPCVVLGGGREAFWWEQYSATNAGLGGLEVARKLKYSHRFLHTIGLLDCCAHHGCWKSKVTKINDDKSVCYKPIYKPGQTIPQCMSMITVEMVTTAILSYYYDGSLPPPPGTRVEEDVKAMLSTTARNA